MTHARPLLYALVLVGILLAYLIGTQATHTLASAPSGSMATQRVATTTVVGPQSKVTIFSTNSVCTSRIIRTQGTGIFLVFADPTNGDLASSTLVTTKGFFQSASTTVAYDSGLYGCGRMVGYAEASTTITAAEMN